MTTAEDWLRTHTLHIQDYRDRPSGSVWLRRLFDILPDVPEGCDTRGCYCTVPKGMAWRPPEIQETRSWYRMTVSSAMLHWPVEQLPTPEQDFTLGPEYPTGQLTIPV